MKNLPIRPIMTASRSGTIPAWGTRVDDIRRPNRPQGLPGCWLCGPGRGLGRSQITINDCATAGSGGPNRFGVRVTLKKGDNVMNSTMIQVLIWVACGVALLLLLQRRRRRKVVR
jgi:hypothetical protein